MDVFDYYGYGGEGAGDETMDETVYYRVYLNTENLVCVVEMCSTDEYDYRPQKFFRDADGQRMKFEKEHEARAFVNRTFRRECIRPEDLTPNHPSFMLSGDEGRLQNWDAGYGPDC